MRRAKAQAGAAWAAAGLPGRVVSTSQSESGSNYTSTGSCGDGEGGGPWRRGGAAATGRAADLGGDGAAATGRAADLGGDGGRRRRGGRRTLVARGSGGDGEGGGPWWRRRAAARGGGGDGEGGEPWWRGRAAATGRAVETEGWQSHCRPRQYIVSSLARVRWHECACARCT